jgi:endonuclease/exonuclease/phosphatase family metal-dependent hydrolase
MEARNMKSKFSMQVLGVLTAAVVAGSMLPGQGAATAASTSERNYLRVGSFNIVGVNADKRAHGNQKTWKKRRPVVVRQILSRKLDVVGVQEANQSTIYKRQLTYGSTQYRDLRGALKRKGGHYALTNVNAYNCARPTSTYKCKAKYMGASGDNRILYNTDRISLVRAGSLTFSAHAAGKPQRFMAWAVLRVKATGKQFLFTTTHLDPYSITARKSQWNQLIAKINSLKGSLPVIATGDYNTSKFSDYAGTYIPRMKSNGYGDVVNQVPKKNTLNYRRAQSVERAWVNSFNAFRRSARDFGYDNARDRIGNGIDWIFASNNLPVKKWEVVVDISPRTLRVRGVIPSDHCLVRATLVL